MDPTLPEFPRLLLQALVGAEESGVLENAEGEQVQVERWPDFVHAVLERSPGGHEGTEVWRHEASAERPRGYPLGVPFVPGATGLVVRSGDRTTAVGPWRDQEEPAPVEMLPLGFATPGPSALDLFLETGEAALEAALGEGLERLVAEGLAAGGELEGGQFTGPPFIARQLRLGKPERVLFLTLSSAGGAPELVLLELGRPS